MDLRSRDVFVLAHAVALLFIVHGPVASAQTGQPDVTSREVSFGAGFTGPRDVISREVSFGAGFAGPRDVISREVSFSAPTPMPDLAFDIAGVQVPASGEVNQIFELRWRVRNAGELLTAGDWHDVISFSQPIRQEFGPTATAFDIPINVPPLAPGAGYSRTLRFEMPSNPGSFQVTIRTDVTNLLPEANEGNNQLGPNTITVTVAPFPNLMVGVTGAPTGSVRAGSQVAISFRVWNAGNSATNVPVWRDRVYLSLQPPPSAPSNLIALRDFFNPTPLLPDPNGTGAAPGSSYFRLDETVTLPTDRTGPCYLAVRTDADDVLVETNSSDNLAFSGPFTVLPRLLPDLFPRALSLDGQLSSTVTVPCSDIPSGSFFSAGSFQNLRWRTGNVGQTAFLGGSIAGQVWISNNSTIFGPTALAGDIVLPGFSNNVAGIPANGDPNQDPVSTHQVFIPPNLNSILPSGCNYYYFKFRLDPNDAIAEDETQGVAPHWNNLAVVGPYQIRPRPTSDLEVAPGAGLVPGHPVAQVASPLVFQWTVRDLASLPDWPVPFQWHDRVTLVLENPIGGEPFEWLIGAYSESAVPTVQGGNTVWHLPETGSSGSGFPYEYRKTASFLLPTSLRSGTYHLRFETDVLDEVYESAPSPVGEFNNVLPPAFTVSFPIQRNPADLEALASGVPLPAQAAPGDSLPISWTARNLPTAGATSVSAWYDHVYLSTSATSHAGASLLLSIPRSAALGAGQTYTVARTALVPQIAPGNYWVHVVVDATEAVFEEASTRGNNVLVRPLVITNELSDIVVDQVSASLVVDNGDSVQVTWTVRNAGVAPTGAGSWNDTAYLASGPTLGGAAQIRSLGAGPQNSTLAPGQTYSRSAAFPIPAGTPTGTWHVIVLADSDDRVVEAVGGASNERVAPNTLSLQAPTGGGGGGGGGGTTGQGWLPANLVVHDVTFAGSTVTAGQSVVVSWGVTNQGIGPTNVPSWPDQAWLSLDPALGSGDVALGYALDTGALLPGATRQMNASFVVPAWAYGDWYVFVRADPNASVLQSGSPSDDIAQASALLHVVAAPLTQLHVVSATVPSALTLGEPLSIGWTTRNDSTSSIPAGWSWVDGFWLVPAGGSLSDPRARFLANTNNGGPIAAGGERLQTSSASGLSATIPPVPPGSYDLLVLTDVAGQILEANEGDNTFRSSPITISAIPLSLGGASMATGESGSARWFELQAPANRTVDIELEHEDPNARCELLVRAATPPNLGLYDFAGDGLGAIDPHIQRARIPRTTGERYFVMARTVSGSASGTQLEVRAVDRPFEILSVDPRTIGAGTVTLSVRGGQLWRAAQLEFMPESAPQPPNPILARELRLQGNGTLLALVDLSGQPLGDWTVTAVDTTDGTRATWLPHLVVVEPAPLSLSAELNAPQSIRRGEHGFGALRLTNTGNVDIPFAVAAVGHAHGPAELQPAQQVRLTSPDLSTPYAGGDEARDALLFVVEDLAPGSTREIDVELAVGAEHQAENAVIGFVARPFGSPEFVSSILTEHADRLRAALLDDPATPAAITEVVVNTSAWDAALSAALAAGLIHFDLETIQTSTSEVSSSADVVTWIAEGLAIQLGVSSASSFPASSIERAARNASCAPLADTNRTCDELFPLECGLATAASTLTAVEGLELPLGAICTGTPGPHDPNEKLPPLGQGATQTVSAARPMEYQVHFENESSASAWASRILIQDQLDPGFLASSLRLQQLRVGEATFQFPSNVSSYSGLIQLEIAPGNIVPCQLSALVDAGTSTLLVLLQALDPVTGLPNSAGDRGLLPPNGPGLGQRATGYVKFSVRNAPVSSTGLAATQTQSGVIRQNTTNIQLNSEPPLRTNTTANTLDGGTPRSSLQLVSVQGNQVGLAWGGDDTEALLTGEFPGTGIASYSLFVGPTDMGPWSPLLTGTQATSFTYVGAIGERVAFKVESTDNVLNAESKFFADVVVSLEDCNGNGVPDAIDIQSGVLHDENRNGVGDECECRVESVCTSTTDGNGRTAHLQATGLPSVSLNGFGLTATEAVPFARGLFLMSAGEQSLPFGDNVLCITAPFLRMGGTMTDGTGGASVSLDLQAPPLDQGTFAIAPGDVRTFQFWFRTRNLPASSGVDLSDAVRVTFCQ